MAVALVLSSCGGGGDDETTAEAASTTIAVTVAPATTVPVTPVTVAVTTTTEAALVTDGAKLIVANASGINGAATRMSDALAIAGFSTGAPTNSSEGQLPTTKVYFDPENPVAEAIANSIRVSLGGGTIQVLEMSTPAPVDTGEVGDASIVVAMGNDVADKTLAELQGLVAVDTSVAADGADADDGEASDG